MVIGRVYITINTEENPFLVKVDSDSPNGAGFFSRRRSQDLTFDGELQDQWEAEMTLAYPENEPV